MTWEYREFDVHEGTMDRGITQRLSEGWELVGLHRKVRRSRTVIVAIMRKANPPQAVQEDVRGPLEARIA
jgi:hypothetical protein